MNGLTKRVEALEARREALPDALEAAWERVFASMSDDELEAILAECEGPGPLALAVNDKVKALTASVG